MKISNTEIEFSEADLKEVFGLFSSPSRQELQWNYDQDRPDYFERISLSEEYELTQEKREFALDALRATLFYLHRAGYRIEKDGKIVSLAGIQNFFV